MPTNLQSAARSCLCVAAATLSIGATYGITRPLDASGASPRTLGNRAYCLRSGRHRPIAARTLSKRAITRSTCRAHRSGRHNPTLEPVHRMPPSPPSSPASNIPTGDGETQTSTDDLITPEPANPLSSTSEPAFRFFSPSSFWNTEQASNAVLDPESAELVDAFDVEIERELQNHSGPGISTTSYSVPIYTVPSEQPVVLVRLVSQSSAPALQAAWENVPLPPNAQSAQGTDGNLVVWQPSADRLWEFWRLVHGSSGWQASWGGAMQNVSSNPGVYGPEAWPGAKSWWGSSASSVSIAGGLITLEDLQRGRINHALAIAIPHVRSGVYASPAKRTDGKSSSPMALPEGAHLRLDPKLNLSTLHLPRLTLMIAEAAQRYGIVVRDGASVIHFFAQDPVSTGSNPYIGPEGYFEGKYPGELLATFPWGHLQLLNMELHKTS